MSALAFSPDGRHLAFVMRTRSDDYDETDPARRAPRRIERLQFTSNGEGYISDRPAHVYVLSLDGTGRPRNLTPGASACTSPSWFPDSRLVAIEVNHFAAHLATEIAVVDLDGNRHYLTDGTGTYAAPAVAPDGSAIAVLGYDDAETAFYLRMDALDPADDARARGLWDVAGLCEGYERSERDLHASLLQLPRLDEGQAMVESYLLGGRILRQLVLDPLLPDPIAPTHGRRRLVDAMKRYDEAGRLAWSAFMARHGAPHTMLPTDGASDPVALH